MTSLSNSRVQEQENLQMINLTPADYLVPSTLQPSVKDADTSGYEYISHEPQSAVSTTGPHPQPHPPVALQSEGRCEEKEEVGRPCLKVCKLANAYRCKAIVTKVI